MAAQPPYGGGTPDGEDLTPPVPDEVWQRFLTDSEPAIRRTAPRELSARERTAPARPRHLLDPRERPARKAEPPPVHGASVSPYEAEAVGELWQAADPWPGPPWRDLDGRARRHRAGRVLGTAAAITVVLGLFALLTAPDSSYDEQGDSISQQSEQAPTRWPTTAATPNATITPPE